MVAAWYLNEYPAVIQVIFEGLVESAQSHFLSAGYFEGRVQCRLQVGAKSYRELYDDTT